MPNYHVQKLLVVALFAVAAHSPAAAQFVEPPSTVTHYVVPQHRIVPAGSGISAGVTLTQVDARVSIDNRVASTVLDLTIVNRSPMIAEAVLLVPVPAGASVKRFSYEGPTNSPSEGVAQVLPRDEARQLYDSIVRASRDPGLLEFAGATLVRSSVFPIAAGAHQRVRIEWEEVIGSIDGRMDYILPRSESLRYETPWTLSVSVTQPEAIAAVYSPSHELIEIQPGRAANARQFTLSTSAQRAPGPFLMSIVAGGASASARATVVAYPSPSDGGGYFMLLGGVAAPPTHAPPIAREVTIVLDRSGSMAGGKLDQAKSAALQVVEGLKAGERFNLIDYSNSVSMFAREPVEQNAKNVAEARAYLEALRPTGGTNISDALVEALRQPHVPGTMPIVLFLTDGLPTVGQTSERAIRELVEKGNPHNRRIFTIGVGADVNAPLLDRVSDLTRARTTYIVPGENVELKVAQVFRQLQGPVLTDVVVTALDQFGAQDTRRVRDFAPRHIPDVFDGEQLVVFGAYLGEQTTTLSISGRTASGQLDAKVSFDPALATTRHAYVARLWATRRIAELVDEVRQFAADRPGQPVGAPALPHDPRVKELVDEIVRLSARFGVLTEYTAFFANAGTNLSDWNSLAAGCGGRLESASRVRSGEGAISQGVNFNDMKGKAQLAYDNRFFDETLKETRIQNVQQLSDRCFYNNDGRWIDSELVASSPRNTAGVAVDETVEFGSYRHMQLIQELSAEGRQSVLSLPGDTLVRHRGKNILVHNPLTPGC